MAEHAIVRIRRLVETATLPRRATPRAAGYDLYASEATTVPPSRVEANGAVAAGRAAVATGIAMAIPDGLYGRVAPRSGLAFRNGIDVGAGVVDGDFRDEVRVLLFNFSAEPLEVAAGDRIAQIVFERMAAPDLVETDTLDETERTGGFGSTGRR
jgi:dUTP pyrophosphatase